MARKKVTKDIYLDAVETHWSTIRNMYAFYADERPIMLFDVTEQRIYAYPYVDFKKDLKPHGQTSLTEQYEKALRAGQIVVFVRDNQRRRLVSYSLAKEYAPVLGG